MKKEKTVKAVATQEQLNKMVMDYLKASEKQIFQVKYVWEKDYKENFYKVFPKIFNGRINYVEIKMSTAKVEVNIIDTSWVNTKKEFGIFKNQVFPQYVIHKSIKPSVEMRIKMNIVKNFISESNDIESLKVEIKKILQ